MLVAIPLRKRAFSGGLLLALHPDLGSDLQHQGPSPDLFHSIVTGLLDKQESRQVNQLGEIVHQEFKKGFTML